MKFFIRGAWAKAGFSVGFREACRYCLKGFGWMEKILLGRRDRMKGLDEVPQGLASPVHHHACRIFGAGLYLRKQSLLGLSVTPDIQFQIFSGVCEAIVKCW